MDYQKDRKVRSLRPGMVAYGSRSYTLPECTVQDAAVEYGWGSGGCWAALVEGKKHNAQLVRAYNLGKQSREKE